MMLLDLFLNFAQVGLFSVGGGYAAMPLIQARVVEAKGWLTLHEFTDLVTIAEMTPGPMMVNAATFVGMRMAGLVGALTATLGTITPSLVIVSLLAYMYQRYRSLNAVQAVLSCLRPAVVALIASAALTILQGVLFAGASLCLEQVQVQGALLFAAALALLRIRKMNPIGVMVLCGGVSLAVKWVQGVVR